MLSSKKILTYSRYVIHRARYKHKYQVTLDPGVEKELESGKLKHKLHPGIVPNKVRALPARLQYAIEKLLSDYPVKNLSIKSDALAKYLTSRQLAVEDHVIQSKGISIEQDILKKEMEKMVKKHGNELTDEVLEGMNKRVKAASLKTLKTRVYNWKPMEYSAFDTICYLLGCGVQQYHVLRHIFTQISQRDPDFNPNRLFDFGSGVGTATWAANQVWRKSLVEHYCVDKSSDMNTLAKLLLLGGDENNEQMAFKGVFFKEFFRPESNTRQYDVVVSAYSLMELKHTKDRLEVVESLWKRTNGYLVLVEYGSNAGFQCIHEARDHILQLNAQQSLVEGADFEGGHVFAPCPHELPCPRFTQEKKTPCNFPIRYKKLTNTQNLNDGNVKTDVYSYLVMKRGPRTDPSLSWPRVVREGVNPKHCSYCRVCTSTGTLDEAIISKGKSGKHLYKVAKYTAWGDRLPVKDTPQSEKDNLHPMDTDSETLKNVVADDLNHTDGNQRLKDTDSLSHATRTNTTTKQDFEKSNNNPPKDDDKQTELSQTSNTTECIDSHVDESVTRYFNST
ncbi:unnamed protein product [Owenia fusiformis]|uniref:Methyltransferase-like protein 17, mitochondrial n=1 Tax=Owenia fusiformis TaxID=6347 RepID=A0A8S4PEE7_OWEFU|nr:unnamed protein product [Owenia fusiformis]